MEETLLLQEQRDLSDHLSWTQELDRGQQSNLPNQGRSSRPLMRNDLPELKLSLDKEYNHELLKRRTQDIASMRRANLQSLEKIRHQRQMLDSIVSQASNRRMSKKTKKLHRHIQSATQPWLHHQWEEGLDLSKLEEYGYPLRPDERLLRAPAVEEAFQANKAASQRRPGSKGPISPETLDLIHQRILHLSVEQEVEKQLEQPTAHVPVIQARNRKPGDPRNRPDTVQQTPGEFTTTERLWTQRARKQFITAQAKESIKMLEQEHLTRKGSEPK